MTANVAAKLLLLPMKRERQAAIRTLRHVTAFRALQRSRVAAPVQKQNRLLATFEPLGDGFLELWRKNRDAFLPALAGRGLAHVHDAYVRHFLVVHALRQFEQRIFAVFAIVIAFQRRCGRTEHDDGIFHPAAHNGHVAGMVARRFLLLVGVLVFLVHDDEAERLDRRKNRRTGANDDAGTALADFVPFVMAFAGGQMRMQDRHERLQSAGTEPRLESLDRLRCERDFRHKHNRTLASFERVGEGLEVDFRLARAGDSMKQENLRWLCGVRFLLCSTRVSRVMFGVPPNIFKGVGCHRRPDVRIIFHGSDQPNRPRVVPNVIPGFVQVCFGSNQAVKGFIRPDRPGTLHHLVHLVGGK